MKLKKKFAGRRTVRLLIILGLVIVFPVVYSVVGHVLAGPRGMALPYVEQPAPQFEKCVRNSEFMRYHHWELLRDIRDQVMREGKRSEITLTGCRECHPSRERFCNRCHQAVSLTPDCFGCHYYPENSEPVTGASGSQLGSED